MHDYFNQIERPIIYLCKPNGNKVCCLNGVDVSSVNLNNQTQTIAELTFDVNRYVSYQDIYTESNGYDYLSDGMYLYLDGFGYLRMKEPSYDNDGSTEVKHITAYGTEVELQDKDLVGWKVNCGSTDSLEYLADNNVDLVTGLALNYVLFYNKKNPQLSLMDLVLEKLPQWRFEFANKKSEELLSERKFSFDVDSQNIFDFLVQTVSTTAKCIFDFNRVNRTILCSIVTDEENNNYYGENTNILLSYRTLLDSVNIECASDNIYTRFNVAGADNLTIESINFGESRIVNLNSFLSPMYFGTQECVEKYVAYRDGRENLRLQYVDNLRQYRKIQLDIDELINRVPNDGCENDWNTYGEEELNQYLDYFNNLVVAFENDQEYFVDGKFSEDKIKESPAWHDYKCYKYYIIPNIETAIANLGVPEDDKEELNKDWETDWLLYGRDELKAKMDTYKEQADILAKQGFNVPYSQLNEETKNTYTQEQYTIYYNNWYDYNTNYNNCKKAYDERCAEITTKQEEQEKYNDKMLSCQEQAQMEHWRWGFTKDEILTIQSLYRDTDYSNEHILTTSLDDIITTIEKQEELLADARMELDKVAHPQYQFNTTIGNLFLLPEFQSFRKYMKIGNFIRINVRDNYTEKLRLIGMTYNPFMVDSTLGITFSSMITYGGFRNDFDSLLSASASTAKNQITSNGSSSVNDSFANIQISNELLKAIANGSYFGNMMEQTKTEAVTQSISLNNFTGQFDSYMPKYMNSTSFRSKIVDMIRSYVDERFTAIEQSIADLTTRLNNIVTLNELTDYVPQENAEEDTEAEIAE